MELIRPFASLRPAPQFTEKVVAPPYDVISTEEARERAADNPYSFLHISKPEIDLEKGIDPFIDQVYERGMQNLQKMINEGVLVRESQPCYYLYRMIRNGQAQTGLAATVSAEAYLKGDVRKHELTRPEHENDRVKMIDTVNAQASPVLLSCKPSDVFKKIVAEATQGVPDMATTSEDGVEHQVWVVSDSEKIEQISRLFNTDGDAVPYEKRLYIADGHHRSAASSKVYEQRRAKDNSEVGAKNYHYFLSVIYPSDEMTILDYNRVIRELNGLSEHDFLHQVEQNFNVTPSNEPVAPKKSGQFGLYLPGKWYLMELKEENRPDHKDPIASLEVTQLNENLIRPILGIEDQRRDKRIEFVGGIRGMAELERKVDSGEFTVAISLFATQMEQIMAVSDANQIMPPKSTWFEPKLVDGLITHVLD